MLFPIDVVSPDPSKIAFRMCETGEQVTYAQLDVRANQVAQVMRSCGVGPGDHVAVLLKNHRRFLEACFGMDRCGVYYTTISTRLNADEVAYIVADCSAKVLVVSADIDETAAQLRQLLPAHVRCFSVGGSLSGFSSWEDAVDSASPLPITDQSQGLDMLYSSGTTGRPKGSSGP